MHTQEDLAQNTSRTAALSNLVTARAEGRSGREPKLNHQRASRRLFPSSRLQHWLIATSASTHLLSDPNTGPIRLRPV